jgi:hypothetical protein
MSREDLKTMYSDDRSRRVVIFRRQDGTYGFEEQVREGPHRAFWVRSGHHSASRFDSEGLATYECIVRVSWLTDLLVVGQIPEGADWRRVAGPPPMNLGRARVICFSPIDERHRCTGQPVVNMCGRLGVIAGVAICEGYFLFGCDSEWRPFWDSWHQTEEEAMTAAEEQYEGVCRTWNRCAEQGAPADRPRD